MFRIKKYPKGYVVEILIIERKFLFFKTKKWVHYISVTGIDRLPWYHSTFDFAMMSLLDKVKEETLKQ